MRPGISFTLNAADRRRLEATGLRMLLRDIEAQFTATAEAIAAEDAALAA